MRRRSGRATLTIETFDPLPGGSAVEDEAARLLAFAAPGAGHEIRAAPVAG